MYLVKSNTGIILIWYIVYRDIHCCSIQLYNYPVLDHTFASWSADNIVNLLKKLTEVSEFFSKQRLYCFLHCTEIYNFILWVKLRNTYDMITSAKKVMTPGRFSSTVK